MIYFFILKAFVIPLTLFVFTFKYKFKSTFSIIIHQLFTLSWIISLIIVEDFSVISIYWRILLELLLLIQLAFALVQCFKLQAKNSRVLAKWGTFGYGMLGFFYFIYAIYCCFMNYVPQKERSQAVQLHFPLADGFYDIVHGGMHTTINYHNAYITQKYAVDITKINAFGLRKIPFANKGKLTNYGIYEDTVFSPVEGSVVDIVDGIGENIEPGERTRLSNMIVLNYKDYFILLIHLKPGSFKVKKGDLISLNQPIAEVGNSGNSTEPHLHIHVIHKMQGGPSQFINAPSIPFHFNGHFLKRNDIIYHGKLLMR